MSLPARRALRAGAIAVAALACTASAASAATVTFADGVLTYTGTEKLSDVGFGQSFGPNGTITSVGRDKSNDSDPFVVTSIPGCTYESTQSFDSYRCQGVKRIVARGNDGRDWFDARGVDTLTVEFFGDGGNDLLFGGRLADTLHGGADSDHLRGDFISGTSLSDDRLFGDAGDDTFSNDGGGDDEFHGGDGYDTILASAYGEAFDSPVPSVLVTLDDAPNDRASGRDFELDDVGSDVEVVRTRDEGPSGGDDTIVGSDAANLIASGIGNDTIDGRGGSDQLYAGTGDDTIGARDGVADLVDCGEGTDVAEVDTLDTVVGCETVNRADPPKEDDKPGNGPPAATPGNGPPASTPGNGPPATTPANGPPVVVPPTPSRRPVGLPARLEARVTPARSRGALVVRTTGRVRLPAGVTASQACGTGLVSIQAVSGKRTISVRHAALRRDCTFSSTVRFADRSRLPRSGRLRFVVRFTGNAALDRSAALTTVVSLR